MWLPWDIASQFALVIAICVMLAGIALSPERMRSVEAVANTGIEVARVLVLYSIWQFIRQKTITKVAGAHEHGRWVWDFERTLRFPSELALQRALIDHRLVMQSINVYYAGVHVPAMGLCLVWLFWRHRDRYPAVRNILAMTTLGVLLIQMVPVAPPRLLPELGFVDAGLLYGQSVYGTGGSGISNQLAAMPSMHYAWCFIVCLAVVRISRSRWRWLIVLHPILTALAVTATANHWWLDGVVAGMILIVAIATQAGFARVAPRLRQLVLQPLAVPGVGPVPVPVATARSVRERDAREAAAPVGSVAATGPIDQH